MAWTFRKRIKAGPINVNLSRSGVGLSAGAGPFRAGVDAKGRRYTSVRGPFGLYNRKYYKRTENEVANPNADAVKDAFVVLVMSVVSLLIYVNAGLGPENQNQVILFAVATGVPAVLGLFGYCAGKDRNTGWFQVVAVVLKIEKWLVLGLLLVFLVLATSSSAKKRR